MRQKKKYRHKITVGYFNINGKLTQCKINWRKLIQRMDENRLRKKNNYKPEGRRNIRKPQTRWEDDFREEGTGQGDRKSVV